MFLSLSRINTFRVFVLGVLDFQGMDGPEFQHIRKNQALFEISIHFRYSPFFLLVNISKCSLGHFPSHSAYILSRAHVQGNLCPCLCFLFGSCTSSFQICGLPGRAGLMLDRSFLEKKRANTNVLERVCFKDQKLK